MRIQPDQLFIKPNNQIRSEHKARGRPRKLWIVNDGTLNKHHTKILKKITIMESFERNKHIAMYQSVLTGHI